MGITRSDEEVRAEELQILEDLKLIERMRRGGSRLRERQADKIRAAIWLLESLMVKKEDAAPVPKYTPAEAVVSMVNTGSLMVSGCWEVHMCETLVFATKVGTGTAAVCVVGLFVERFHDHTFTEKVKAKE